MAVEKHPCEDGLTEECFERYPAWAKQAFAYKLIHTLFPPWLTRRLPKWLRLALIGEGAILPPGFIPVDGMTIPPGYTFPPGWTAGDPVPPGVTIPPGTVFPPGWTAGDPVPAGVTLEPGASFPPGWTAGDPVPWSFMPFPPRGIRVPPGGLIPPLFIGLQEFGPRHIFGLPPPPGLTTVTIESSTADGWVENDGPTWNTVRSAVTGKLVDDNDISYTKAAAVLHYSPTFYVYRSFFYFDLSVIPAGSTIESATFNLQSHIYYSGNITIQEGTQADPLTTADFGSFEDTVFADVIFHSGNNYISMNAAGRAYLEAQFGSMAKLCFRDSDYDVSGIQPPNNTSWKDSCYYAETIEEKRPRLTIVYK